MAAAASDPGPGQRRDPAVTAARPGGRPSRRFRVIPALPDGTAGAKPASERAGQEAVSTSLPKRTRVHEGRGGPCLWRHKTRRRGIGGGWGCRARAWKTKSTRSALRSMAEGGPGTSDAAKLRNCSQRWFLSSWLSSRPRSCGEGAMRGQRIGRVSLCQVYLEESLEDEVDVRRQVVLYLMRRICDWKVSCYVTSCLMAVR